MPRYRVLLQTNAETSVEVEADDPEEAVDKACEEAYVSLCYQCGNEATLGDVWEPYCALDESGKEVWSEKV